ncbi:MAG: hypothetical protein IJI43_00925 [Bacilli bacterium]|nr:hypothetical protein [Bacilli bacterium]
MRELNNSETLTVTGGSTVTTIGIGLIVSSIMVFLSGIANGFTNPGRCNIEGS